MLPVSCLQWYLCLVSNVTFVLSPMLPVSCLQCYLCLVSNVTCVLSPMLPVSCLQCYLCLVSNVTCVLSPMLPVSCLQCYLCLVSNVTCVLSPMLPVSLEFAPDFKKWAHVLHVVLLCIFMFLVSCYDAFYNIRIQRMFLLYVCTDSNDCFSALTSSEHKL